MKASYTPDELAQLRALAMGRRWLPFRGTGTNLGWRGKAVQWFQAEHQLRQGFAPALEHGYSSLPDPLTGVRFATPTRLHELPLPVLDGAGAVVRARVPEGAWVLEAEGHHRRLCEPLLFVKRYVPAWWPERKRLTRDEYLAQGECR